MQEVKSQTQVLLAETPAEKITAKVPPKALETNTPIKVKVAVRQGPVRAGIFRSEIMAIVVFTTHGIDGVSAINVRHRRRLILEVPLKVTPAKVAAALLAYGIEIKGIGGMRTKTAVGRIVVPPLAMQKGRPFAIEVVVPIASIET